MSEDKNKTPLYYPRKMRTGWCVAHEVTAAGVTIERYGIHCQTYAEGGYVTSPAGDSSYREFLEAAKELRASCEAIKLIKAYIVYQDLEKAKETIDNARDTFTRGK